jgi:hypothetical protein
MNAKNTVLAAAALTALGFVSAAANEIPEREDKGGAVTPCSLTGVNPAYHPHIFGNPARAKSYGFVKSADGSWHVEPNCRR